MSDQPRKAKLINHIGQYFGKGDLRLLVANMGIDYELYIERNSFDLSIEALVDYVERRGRTDELIQAINKARPNVEQLELLGERLVDKNAVERDEPKPSDKRNIPSADTNGTLFWEKVSNDPRIFWPALTLGGIGLIMLVVFAFAGTDWLPFLNSPDSTRTPPQNAANNEETSVTISPTQTATNTPLPTEMPTPTIGSVSSAYEPFGDFSAWTRGGGDQYEFSQNEDEICFTYLPPSNVTQDVSQTTVEQFDIRSSFYSDESSFQDFEGIEVTIDLQESWHLGTNLAVGTQWVSPSGNSVYYNFIVGEGGVLFQGNDGSDEEFSRNDVISGNEYKIRIEKDENTLNFFFNESTIPLISKPIPRDAYGNYIQFQAYVQQSGDGNVAGCFNNLQIKWRS